MSEQHDGSPPPMRFFDELRHRLEQEGGRKQWRSFDEIAETDAFRELVSAEFPQAYEPSGESRRDFMKMMGASLALAGFGPACVRQPKEEIVPYVEAPEFLVPGKPLLYATTVNRGGYGVGVVVETHEARPTKVEGNRLHPASLGATGAIEQAEMLNLYGPHRAQTPIRTGLNSTWRQLTQELAPRIINHRRNRGGGLRILIGEHASPTLEWQLENLRQAMPETRVHQWEAIGRRNVRAGARRAFGRTLETRYDLAKVDVLAVFDADLFGAMPGSLAYARTFMARRIPSGHEKAPDNRLYAFESTPTLAGTVADHRVRVRSVDIGFMLGRLAQMLGVRGLPALSGQVEKDALLRALSRDLLSARGRSAVVVGDEQPADVHALAHRINAHLSNTNRTVLYTEPVVKEVAAGTQSIEELAADMKSGQVQTLMILGGNPVYDAPADLEFRTAMDSVPMRVHLGDSRNETAVASHWYVPESHAFEAWSDTRAFDGTISIQQPLIRPLYASKSIHEVLAFVLGQTASDKSSSLVQEYWRTQRTDAGFDAWWNRSLHDGVMRDTALPLVTPTLNSEPARVPPAAPNDDIEITLRADPSVWDGRFISNGWLQELPRPITKLTWDNAAHVSPRTAEALNVRDESILVVAHQDRTLRVPVLVVPGQADRSVMLHLGYGQKLPGQVGDGVGANAYVLRSTKALDTLVGAQVRVAPGERLALAVTQKHHQMEGRNLIRYATSAEYAAKADFATAPDHTQPLSLYADWDYSKGPQWGMSINLNTCVGCNACVIACQSENNIAVVGKEEVRIGREMHWIRLDRYYEGSLDDPAILQQPVTCMHCEKAPCEVVCPVAATVHGPEGLNQMVYNRCVGTRYCSNNCPYKVRRFNFYLFSDWETPSLKGMRNPDVTVRSRGVMEKCTYCVQRISEARIEAKKQRREIRDGEVVTACQSACPTRAISFGSILGDTEVAKVKSSPLNYTLLEELRTQPRTSYLARVTNPNPNINTEDAQGG